MAEADAFTGDEDAVIEGNVLDNDSDADGDALTVTAATFVTAAGGSVVVLANGDFTYTPAEGFHGSDSFDYALSDGEGGSATGTVSLTIESVNDAPTLVAAATATVAENTTAVTTVSASDPDGGQVLSYGLSGADAALFVIDEDGALSFVAAPNFEAPGDAGGDNIYDVTVTVSDGADGTDEQAIEVTVTDEFENTAPTLVAAASATIAENTTAVLSVSASDPDAGQVLSYALSGADAALFEIDEDGALRFLAAPDFEAPGDAGGDNIYDVTVTVSDGAGGTDEQAIEVTVTDIFENTAPTLVAAATATVAENTTAVLTVSASDPDGGQVLSYGVSGTDAGLFAIDANGALSFVNAPNFEAPVGGDNIYDVTVTVSDGAGGTDAQAIEVTVSNVSGVFGPTDDRWINGTGEEDLMSGLGGRNTMNGFGGNDTISGGDENDTLKGGAGMDSLAGGSGADVILGFVGNDRLTGGGDADRFVFGAGFGKDRVTDFDANPVGGQDRLDVTGLGITAANFVARVTITDLGPHTLVMIDGDASDTIRLEHVANASTITQDDFILAV